MSSSSRCCFLGLSTEIRSQIYQELFVVDLECHSFENWRDRQRTGRGKHPYSIIRRPGVILRVPWVQMLVVCKKIASEIRDLRQSKTFLDNPVNRTWQLDAFRRPLPALNSDQFGRYGIRDVSWQRLPCAPEEVHTLVISVRWQLQGIDRNYYTRDERDDLCRTLQYVMHCGPRMSVSSRLRVPMHIRDVVLRLELEDSLSSEEKDCMYWSSFSGGGQQAAQLMQLSQLLGTWVNIGIGHGFVDKVHIRSKSGGKWFESASKCTSQLNQSEVQQWMLGCMLWGMKNTRPSPPRLLGKDQYRALSWPFDDRREAIKARIRFGWVYAGILLKVPSNHSYREESASPPTAAGMAVELSLTCNHDGPCGSATPKATRKRKQGSKSHSERSQGHERPKVKSFGRWR